MGEVWFDIDGDAVEGNPLAQADTDGGDLVLGRRAVGQGGPVRPHHPHPDAVLAPLALHVEGGEGADDPLFERGHEGAHILAPPLQVEHDIGHALAGAVIGVFAAAPCVEDGKAVGVD